MEMKVTVFQSGCSFGLVEGTAKAVLCPSRISGIGEDGLRPLRDRGQQLPQRVVERNDHLAALTALAGRDERYRHQYIPVYPRGHLPEERRALPMGHPQAR